MQVSAEALGPKSARELLAAEADEVLLPCIDEIDDTIDKAGKVHGGTVTVHTPANRVDDPQRVVDRLHEAGVTSVLMVSGNPGHGRGTSTLYELIPFFRRQGLHVSVGAYPEDYFRTTSAAHRSKSASILVDKQAAGAQRIITQASFSIDNLERWLMTLRSRGIDVPVHVGVMAEVPGKAIGAVLRKARAELFSHPRAEVANKPNLDMMFRMLWSHVPSPEAFIERVGALDEMGHDDGFHVFGYGADVSRLIAAGHAAGASAPEGAA